MHFYIYTESWLHPARPSAEVHSRLIKIWVFLETKSFIFGADNPAVKPDCDSGHYRMPHSRQEKTMTRLFLALALMAPALHAHDRGDSPGRTAWVLVYDENSVSMSGDTKDLKLARRHLRELGPEFLWFRHDGKQYVVQDKKVIAQLEEAAKPQEELGAEQSRLGQRQSELGREQGELGRRQGELGLEQSRKAMRRAQSEMNGERVGPSDRDAEQDDSEAQRELSKAQQTMGREQQKMGAEQQKMGEQQRKLSQEFQRKVEALIASALSDGTAKQVND
jgi:bla regulator protein blaR1